MKVTPFIPLILRGNGKTLIFEKELAQKTELLLADLLMLVSVALAVGATTYHTYDSASSK